MQATMTRDGLTKRAATRGYELHESVTDDRLARINPRMLNGKPELLTRKNAIYLDATKEQIDEWIAARCRIASYDLGTVGDVVIAPPATDEQLKLVVLPQYTVVAKCEGQGERTDGERHSQGALVYTILR